MKGKLASLLIALLIISIIPSIAWASDTEGSTDITGKVTVQASQPTVSFSFYSDSDYSTATSQFTPMTPVYMKISVSGNNPMEEVSVEVQLFADNDNTGVGTPPASTNPATYVKFDISYDSNNRWVITKDTGGSSNWSIQLDPDKTQPDPSSSSGDFYVIITFGKTAREANTGDQAPAQDWDVIVTATVGSGDLSNSASTSNYGYTVFFYSEITASANTISFGTLEAGQSSQIQEVDGNAGNSFTVTVIANGYYDLKATSGDWTNDTYQKTIQLVAASPSAGQFSLQIDDSLNQDGDLESPVYVTTDPNTAQSFVDDAGPTTEYGASHNIYMLITLGSNIHTGTYNGTITIHAVDGK